MVTFHRLASNMSISVILGGIVAFIKAVPVINSWIEMLIAAYITSCQQQTLSKIADAAALAAKAKTDDDRYQAVTAWRIALSSQRVQN